MRSIEGHAPGTVTWVDLMTLDPARARAFHGALFSVVSDPTGAVFSVVQEPK